MRSHHLNAPYLPFLLLLFLGGLACSSPNKPAPAPVAPTRSTHEVRTVTPSTVPPPPPAPITPPPPVPYDPSFPKCTGDFKGVSWGTTFNDFCIQKGLHPSEPFVSNAFTNGEIAPNIFIYYMLNVPLRTEMGITSLQEKYVPAKFFNISEEKSDIEYCFYASQFGLAYCPIAAATLDQLKSALGPQYALESKGAFSYPGSGTGILDEYEFLLYSNRENHVHLYLVQETMNIPGVPGSASTFAVYIPASLEAYLRQAIQSNIENEKKAQEQQNESAKQNDLRKPQ